MRDQEAVISNARQKIKDAESLVVLTGAGISADSGIPTFRGKEGLWRNFRAEDLATPEAFSRNPRLVWEWYDWRRQLIASKSPNPAHLSLVELEKRTPRFTLITQNVDGFHRLAGSHNVVEMHGNIWKVRCTHCGEISDNMDIPIAIIPLCPKCNAWVRPHIVWFGEAIDPEHWETCVRVVQTCEVFLVIGTSGLVQPAASLASLSHSSGSLVVEINLQSGFGDLSGDLSIIGRASEMVPKLL